MNTRLAERLHADPFAGGHEISPRRGTVLAIIAAAVLTAITAASASTITSPNGCSSESDVTAPTMRR